MFSDKKNSKECFLFFAGRCFALYLIVACILMISVNRETIAKKTLDYLKDQPTFMLSLAEGKVGFNNGKINDSIRYYQNLIILFPESASAYGVIGYAYYQLKDYDNAIQYYKRAVKHDPDLFGFNFNLGVIYYGQGDYKNASEYFSRALKAPPQKTFVYPRHVDPYQGYVLKGRHSGVAAKLKGGYLKCFELFLLSNKSVDSAQPDKLYYYPPIRVIELNNKKQIVLM